MGQHTLPTPRDLYVIETAVRPFMSARRIDKPAETIEDAFNLAYEQGGEVTIWIYEGHVFGSPSNTITFDHRVANKVNLRIWDGINPQGPGDPGNPVLLNHHFNLIDTAMDIGDGFIFDATGRVDPQFELNRSSLSVQNSQITAFGAVAATTPLIHARNGSTFSWHQFGLPFPGAGQIDDVSNISPNPMFLLENNSQMIIGGNAGHSPSFACNADCARILTGSAFKGREFDMSSITGPGGFYGIYAEDNAYVGIELPAGPSSVIFNFDTAIFANQNTNGFLHDTTGITGNNTGIDVGAGSHIDYLAPPTGNIVDTVASSVSTRLRGYV